MGGLQLLHVRMASVGRLRRDHHELLHLGRLFLAQITRGPPGASAMADQHRTARTLDLGKGHGGINAIEDA